VTEDESKTLFWFAKQSKTNPHQLLPVPTIFLGIVSHAHSPKFLPEGRHNGGATIQRLNTLDCHYSYATY
jgi:hypothetical protein